MRVFQLITACHQDSSGSLYYFFPTKEDLLLAVLVWYMAMLWRMVVQPVFERVSDPIERVFGILDGYRRQTGVAMASLCVMDGLLSWGGG